MGSEMCIRDSFPPHVDQVGWIGNVSKSSTYIMKAKPICLWLFRQAVDRPFSFARAKAGRSSPANIAMMAITTSNSIRVKPSGAESERFDRDRITERKLCLESAVGNRYFLSSTWPSGWSLWCLFFGRN